MKIIIPNLPIPIFFDIIQCLETTKHMMGIEPLFWNVEAKSMMDMFDESKPNIIFIHESQLDKSFDIISNEYNFKYILFTSNEKVVEPLVKKPNLILTLPLQRQNFSTNNNIMNVKPIVKVAQIHNAHYSPKLISEVLVNTTQVINDDNFQQVLAFLIDNYKTKIIGDQPVPFLHYLGETNIFERANFIKSAQVVVDFSLQEILDAAYLNIPSISSHQFNNSFLHFTSTTELKQQIDSLLHNQLIRKQYINNIRDVAMNNTSYHFASEIFNKINEAPIAQTLLTYIEEGL